MRKKALAILLAFCMVVAMVPTAWAAASPAVTGGEIKTDTTGTTSIEDQLKAAFTDSNNTCYIDVTPGTDAEGDTVYTVTLNQSVTLAANTKLTIDGVKVTIVGPASGVTVTGEEYNTFTVKPDGYLTLGTNLHISSTKGSAVYAEGGTVTFDGATVTSGGDATAVFAKGGAIYVNSGIIESTTCTAIAADSATVIIGDGTGTATAVVKTTSPNTHAAAYSRNDGAITVQKGGTVVVDNEQNKSGALIAAKKGTATGGTVTVDGGTVKGGVVVHEDGDSKAEIKSGTVEGNVLVDDTATAVVSGGTITNGTLVIGDTGGTPTVTGGSFDGPLDSRIDIKAKGVYTYTATDPDTGETAERILFTDDDTTEEDLPTGLSWEKMTLRAGTPPRADTTNEAVELKVDSIVVDLAGNDEDISWTKEGQAFACYNGAVVNKITVTMSTEVELTSTDQNGPYLYVSINSGTTWDRYGKIEYGKTADNKDDKTILIVTPDPANNTASTQADPIKFALTRTINSNTEGTVVTDSLNRELVFNFPELTVYARGTELSSDTSLKSLTVTIGSDTKTLDHTSTTNKVSNVANTVNSATVTAEATDSNATVTANVNISGGVGTATITVTSSDGTASKTYTIYFNAPEIVNVSEPEVGKGFGIKRTITCNNLTGEEFLMVQIFDTVLQINHYLAIPAAKEVSISYKNTSDVSVWLCSAMPNLAGTPATLGASRLDYWPPSTN